MPYDIKTDTAEYHRPGFGRLLVNFTDRLTRDGLNHDVIRNDYTVSHGNPNKLQYLRKVELRKLYSSIAQETMDDRTGNQDYIGYAMDETDTGVVVSNGWDSWQHGGFCLVFDLDGVRFVRSTAMLDLPSDSKHPHTRRLRLLKEGVRLVFKTRAAIGDGCINGHTGPMSDLEWLLNITLALTEDLKAWIDGKAKR